MGRIWTNKEDAQIRQHVKLHGLKQWETLARQIGDGATGRQARDRYFNHCDPTIVHASWTRFEDTQLFILHEKKNGNWYNIAAAMPGRSSMQVKARYLSRMKKINELATSIKEAELAAWFNNEHESLKRKRAAESDPIGIDEARWSTSMPIKTAIFSSYGTMGSFDGINQMLKKQPDARGQTWEGPGNFLE